MLRNCLHEPHAKGAGRVIIAEPGNTLAGIDGNELLDLLAESGYVLLRGFGGTLPTFSDLVSGMSERIYLDPARTFYGGDIAQKIDAGTDPMGLHIEMGATPWIPHLVWFLCGRPAREGSQTTVCDGYLAWAELSQDAKQMFLSQDLLFSRTVTQERWQTLVARIKGGQSNPGALTFNDLVEVTTHIERTTYDLHPDGSLTYSYRIPAAHSTNFGQRLAFANSILTPSINYEPPRITFADGSELGEDLLAEVTRATCAVTNDIDWQEGDVAVVDNSRVMHGRRRIVDPERVMFNAQSLLNPATLAAAAQRHHSGGVSPASPAPSAPVGSGEATDAGDTRLAYLA